MKEGRTFNDTDYESGLEFCDQLHNWAKDKLADQATTLQDVTQDKTETVEKYHARLVQTFTDLGFNVHMKAHAQMLSAVFVTGLKDCIKKGLLVSRPEV